jgi:hypothetical protein
LWQLIGNCEKWPATLLIAYQTGAYSIARRGVILARPKSGASPKNPPSDDPIRRSKLSKTFIA